MPNSNSDTTPVPSADPSRRRFFHKAGLTAGGLYALATPSLLGPWVVDAQAVETRQHSYIGGRFGLELDSVFCGMINAFEGGNFVAEVVVVRQGQDRLPRKQLGALKIEPFTVEVGLEMTKPWNDWIVKTLNLENVRKNGAIIELDASSKEVGRRTFTNAFISEIEFPALNAASKNPAALTVTIAPDQLKLEAGSGKQIAPPGAKGQKSFISSNYRLNIQGLEQATQKASKIEAFSFKQVIVSQQTPQSRGTQVAPGQVEFTNLAITIPEAFAGPIYAWFDDFVVKGNNASTKERPGVLEFLSPDLKTTIASVQLYGLGVFRVSSEGGGGEKLRQTKVEMYCQRFTFTP